ncbi:hypothetical protein Ga0100230_000020 [Opitutaceae bacterium TAV3]|nr:hypothetical protein Ga0100230_000020 [Opitutaceae bacterium TAV3]
MTQSPFRFCLRSTIAIAALSGVTMFSNPAPAAGENAGAAWPSIPKNAPAIFLVAAPKERTTAPPAFEHGPVFFGTLSNHDSEEIRITPDGMLVLRASGHRNSAATLRWEWPESTAPSGRYTLWTRFTQGGKNTQTFTVSAGTSGSHMEERLQFKQSSNSWDMVWRKTNDELLLFPSDRTFSIKTTGTATQQKQFSGFLLVKTGELPAGLSEDDALAAEQTKPEPLINAAPARWLTVGTWAGPAGLSLWGLDYEPEVRPFPGAQEPVLKFDNGRMAQWTESAPDSRGRVVIEKPGHSTLWAKGSGYAHVYLHAPKAGRVTLHFGHTGAEVQGWLNGHALDWRRDVSPSAFKMTEPSPPSPATGQTDLNDQGGVMIVQDAQGARAHAAQLGLTAGWNRLLLKPVIRHGKEDTFAFGARLTASDAGLLKEIKTSLWNPEPSRVARAIASRYVPSVRTNAPFNLAYAGEPLSLEVDLESIDKLASMQRPLRRPLAEPLTLHLSVTDYDGREILRRATPFRLPGRATFDLGSAPARGYYATHLRLLDSAGNHVVTYPVDGFSVIGGATAQQARKHDKKMAVTYYFMAGRDLHRTLYFPYMKRIGILRNIGGHNTRNESFYKTAAAEGLLVSADMWTHRNPEYIRAYIEETAPYVDSFKSYNEVDIHRDQRGTPASWVAKARQEYEIIKQTKPGALMIGASLVRPASDSWFEECLKLGLADWHDVWDVHCYPQKAPVLEGNMSNSPNETDLGVLKVYSRLGWKNPKPFWIGETGARSSHGRDARRWQAQMVAKMTACALSREDYQRIGFLVPWWYARERGKHLVGDIEAGHMPAEAAYYTASALIDGFGDAAYKRLALGDDVQAAHFGPTIMAWTTDERSREITLRPETSPPFVQVDVVGRVRELTASGDGDGSVRVTINGSPVYVLAKADYARLTAFDRQ